MKQKWKMHQRRQKKNHIEKWIDLTCKRSISHIQQKNSADGYKLYMALHLKTPSYDAIYGGCSAKPSLFQETQAYFLNVKRHCSGQGIKGQDKF